MGARAELWTGVERLIDRAPSLADLRAHRLHLLAADHWQRQGRPVPDELLLESLVHEHRTALARQTLSAIRKAYDGRIVVLKGMAIACRYPSPELRPFGDIDILVDDAQAAQRALLAAGFQPVDGEPDRAYDGHHHLRPVQLPNEAAPMVEVHRRASWVPWSPAPATMELLDLAGDAPAEVDGIEHLPLAHHAVLVAVHAWRELPLRRHGDLLDVALLATDRPQAAEVADRWGVRRLWQTTTAAADALLLADGWPWPLRTWARDLPEVRARTRLERHVHKWAAPFWDRPLRAAPGAAARAIRHDLASGLPRRS